MTILEDRRKALEEQFFLEQENEALAKIRKEQDRAATESALTAVLGAEDAELVTQLMDHGIDEKSLVALGIVPLVWVAWADGKLDERERKAVLQSAASAGVEPGGDGYTLLEGWLSRRPDPALYDAWLAYAAELRGQLSVDARTTLKKKLAGRARSVAEAAGGFLGINTISSDEQAVLDRIDEAL